MAMSKAAAQQKLLELKYQLEAIRKQKEQQANDQKKSENNQMVGGLATLGGLYGANKLLGLGTAAAEAGTTAATTAGTTAGIGAGAAGTAGAAGATTTGASLAGATNAGSLGATGYSFGLGGAGTTGTTAAGTTAGTTAATGATGAGAGAGTTAATEGSLSGVIAPVAGALLTAHGGYGLYKGIEAGNRKKAGLSGAEAGAGIGTLIEPGFGTLVGAGIGGLAGLAAGHIKTGKSKDQQGRDDIRKNLKSNGFIDKDYNLSLADGTTFNIGKDGGARLKGADGKERRQYEIDFTNPYAHQTTAALIPLGLAVSGGDKKLSNQFTGYFVNAALSNANDGVAAKNNILSMYQKAGIDLNAANKILDDLKSQGKIDDGTYNAMRVSVANTFSSGFKEVKSEYAPGVQQPAKTTTPAETKTTQPQPQSKTNSYIAQNQPAQTTKAGLAGVWSKFKK